MDVIKPLQNANLEIPDRTPFEVFLEIYWFLFSTHGVITVICCIIFALEFFLFAVHITSIYFANHWFKPENSDNLKQIHPRDTLPSISILKPVKGSDQNLAENLKSFVQQDYPLFEILFSIQDELDPSHEIVDSIIEKFPNADLRKIKGQLPSGNSSNPKIANLLEAFNEAKHEFIWIADANTYALQHSLLELSANIISGRSFVHQLPLYCSGRQTISQCLNRVYFCTSHARMYLFSCFIGINTTNGMSMLARKSDLTKSPSNGLKAYLSSSMEDNRIATDLAKLSKGILSTIPIMQNPYENSISGFRSRMVRWIRIRMYFKPICSLEPITECIPSGLLMSFSCWYVFGLNFIYSFVLHLIAWFIFDICLSTVIHKRPLGGLSINCLLAWLIRELLVFPNFLQAISSRNIAWGGHYRTLQCCSDVYANNNQ